MQQHRLTLAAAAVAAAALLGACGTDPSTDGSADDGAGTSPTGTTSATPGAGLTTAHLLTDDDTVYSDGADWFRTHAAEGDGQDAFNPCAQESLQGTGAASVVRADFELRNSAGDAPDTAGDHLVEVVGEYDDEAAATKAWATVNGWLEECGTLPDDLSEYRALQTRKVAVDGADAVITDSHFGPVPKEADPTGDAAYIMETGVLRKGNRLVVLTSVIIGQDYNFLEEDGGTPVNRMLPRAAARLDADGSTSSGSASASTEPGAADVPAPLLPDFDLVHGMLGNEDGTPVVATADGRGVGPLEFCGSTLDLAAEAEGRLAANASGPEYGEGREVLVLADEAAADAAVESLLEAVRGCAEQEVGGTTWKHALASYDAAIPTDVVTRSYENDGVPALGLDTVVVSHSGRVVLLAVRSSEGSVGDTAAATRDLVADLETTVGWIVDSLGS